MAKIVNILENRDKIDDSLEPDVLQFVNRRSEEVSSHFYVDINNCLRAKDSDGFVGLNGLKYIIKRALIEGVKWKENEIK